MHMYYTHAEPTDASRGMPWDGVTGGFEPSDMSAGTPAEDLPKSSRSS